LIAPVAEGDIVADKYRVERVLGVGGMGVVVAARHLELDERVAIKFLLPQVITDGAAVARFAKEARAAVKIKGEHVARVIDTGKLSNGAPYIVMEYLEGRDLGTWIAEQGPLTIEQAITFVLEACEAIAEAHRLGIVHRDLKPANLFVIRRPDGAPSVKVLDFGISKANGDRNSPEGVTTTSAVMGSPMYMSPEQMRSSRDVDARSDIWSLGVILYELLTLEPPFAGDSLPALVLKIADGPPRSLRSALPSAPERLEAIILRCLEKDPSRRFQSVADLAEALGEIAPASARPSVARIVGILRGEGHVANAVPAEVIRAEMPGSRRHRIASRGPMLAFGAGLAALGLVMVLAALLRRPPAPKAPVVLSEAAASPAPSPLGDVAPPHGASLPSIVASGREVTPSASADIAPLPAVASVVPSLRVEPPLRGHPVAKTPKPSMTKRDCNPNFYLDAQGDKHFKQECFIDR
jgi:serine/threonine-protein kinase